MKWLDDINERKSAFEKNPQWTLITAEQYIKDTRDLRVALDIAIQAIDQLIDKQDDEAYELLNILHSGEF